MPINTTLAKENILKRIRKALSHTTPLPFPQSEPPVAVFPAAAGELDVQFAENFTQLQGKFIYCNNVEEFRVRWAGFLQHSGLQQLYCRDEALKEQLGPVFSAECDYHDLSSCDAAITACEALVARTGTMVLSAAASQGRTTSVYAPVHVCVAFTDQLVYDIKDALLLLKKKYSDKLPSLISFATGPSRTADIEKTLVVGVHGPKEVYCFLIER